MTATNGVVEGQGTAGTTRQQPSQGGEVPPLVVRGLVVTKADLVRALSLYLPHLVDIDQIDANRFVLTVDAASPHAQGATYV